MNSDLNSVKKSEAVVKNIDQEAEATKADKPPEHADTPPVSQSSVTPTPSDESKVPPTSQNKGSIPSSECTPDEDTFHVENIQGITAYEIGLNSPSNRLEYAKYENELQYITIANKVVQTAREQLNNQQEDKNSLRGGFSVFFKNLIFIQLVFLGFLLVAKACIPWFDLSDTIIITYISSVFVETLGGVIFMITYAFNSKEEVETIKILSSVIQYYQKSNK